MMSVTHLVFWLHQLETKSLLKSLIVSITYKLADGKESQIMDIFHGELDPSFLAGLVREVGVGSLSLPPLFSSHFIASSGDLVLLLECLLSCYAHTSS